ncbi:MAG: hypothetical protein HZB42_02940 [Sphingobacteriales bacterium]|nr:hypothetical protein [Sphingobacteriales bacterium]
MASLKLFLITILISGIQVSAQSEIPKNYAKGELMLFDGSSIKGYIKNDFKRVSQITILNESGVKKAYWADLITRISFGVENYICVKAEFFKVISTGTIGLIQKASDISGKIIGYNGAEPIFGSGSEGEVNDFFFYAMITNNLSLLTKKNYSEVIMTVFKGCSQITANTTKYSFNQEEFISLTETYNSRCGESHSSH